MVVNVCGFQTGSKRGGGYEGVDYSTSVTTRGDASTNMIRGTSNIHLTAQVPPDSGPCVNESKTGVEGSCKHRGGI